MGWPQPWAQILQRAEKDLTRLKDQGESSNWRPGHPNGQLHGRRLFVRLETEAEMDGMTTLRLVEVCGPATVRVASKTLSECWTCD